jgi:hypothetical protein
MCSNRTESSWRSKFYFLIIALYILLCFWGNVCAKNVLTVNSSELNSLTVTYEDGESLEVTKPAIRYVVNPGYTPTRISTCDFIKLVKEETVRNVTTKKEKEIKLSDIASIEFKRKESDWYFGTLTLRDGKELVSKSAVLLWGFDDDKTSEEYRGYKFELYENGNNPVLIGSVVQNGKEGSFESSLFCPRKRSADNISKIVFNLKE